MGCLIPTLFFIGAPLIFRCWSAVAFEVTHLLAEQVVHFHAHSNFV